MTALWLVTTRVCRLSIFCPRAMLDLSALFRFCFACENRDAQTLCVCVCACVFDRVFFSFSILPFGRVDNTCHVRSGRPVYKVL